MTTKSKEDILKEARFKYWSKKFNEKHPNSMLNYIDHFASINERYPVGKRETAYIDRMKEVLSLDPEYNDMLELEKIILETIEGKLTEIQHHMSEAARLQKQIDTIFHDDFPTVCVV